MRSGVYRYSSFARHIIIILIITCKQREIINGWPILNLTNLHSRQTYAQIQNSSSPFDPCRRPWALSGRKDRDGRGLRELCLGCCWSVWFLMSCTGILQCTWYWKSIVIAITLCSCSESLTPKQFFDEASEAKQEYLHE